MSNILIRDVPEEDLAELRAAATTAGRSMQAQLLATIREQAAYLRRQATLAAMETRLRTSAPVAETERAAVLDSIDSAHDARAAQLAGSEPTDPAA